MSLELETIQALIGNQNAMIAKQNLLIEQQSRVMKQILEATTVIMDILSDGQEDDDEEQDNFGYDLSGKPIRN